jgi:hypothetical protein
MSRLRDIKRRMRGDLHAQASVPALYIPVPNAAPIECTVRVWLKSDEMTGAAQQNGSAQMTNPEDRLRFDLSEFQAPLRVQTGHRLGRSWRSVPNRPPLPCRPRLSDGSRYSPRPE